MPHPGTIESRPLWRVAKRNPWWSILTSAGLVNRYYPHGVFAHQQVRLPGTRLDASDCHTDAGGATW